MGFPSFSSLRVRMAAVILLAIQPMLGLTLFTYLEQRNLVVAYIQDDMHRVVSFIANDQEQLLERTRQLLFALVRLPEIREADPDACRTLLMRLLQESPRYGNLAVMDLDGSVICSAAPMTRFDGFSEEPWFRRSVGMNDFAMGTCQLGGAMGDAALIISYPVMDGGDKMGGIAFAAVDLTQFNQLMSHVPLPASAQFSMLSRNGAILSCFPNPEDCLGKSLRDTPLARTITTKGVGTAELPDRDGTLRLYAFAPLSSSVDTGIYVSIGLPAAVVYRDATKILVYHFVGLGLVTLLALCLVWVGSTRVIMKPVAILVRTAQRLSEGDMAARTGLSHTNNELEQVARAFDEMAETLEKRAVQLRSLASQLSLAEERERRRIAVNLHDRVGQALALSNIKLGMLRQLECSAEFSELVDEISNFVEQAIQETRTLMFEISSPILYELGFEAAVKHLTERVGKQHRIVLACEYDQAPKPLDDDVRVLLFQAVNELLVNVVKHARAHRVTVRIRRDGERISVTVDDDGTGFDVSESVSAQTSTSGFGLFSIRERLNHVAGEFVIESERGQGTRATLIAPLKRSNGNS